MCLNCRSLKHLLLFPRYLPVCVVAGLRLLHVSDSSVDGHLLQAPCQPHPALLWLGAGHHCHGHQQVSMCLVLKGGKETSAVSGLLGDSSPKQIAAPKHIRSRVRSRLAVLDMQLAGRKWLSTLSAAEATLALTVEGDNTNISSRDDLKNP